MGKINIIIMGGQQEGIFMYLIHILGVIQIIM